MILNEVMKETVDAIREKTGKSDLIAPVNFAEEIRSISVGGGESNIEYIDVSSLADLYPPDAFLYFGLQAKIEAYDGSGEYIGTSNFLWTTLEMLNYEAKILAIAVDVKSPLRLLWWGENEPFEVTDWNVLYEIVDLDLSSLPRISKEEFYTIKTPPYKSGAYIQHIDGSLYSEEEWVAKGFSNEEANGVYVSNGWRAMIIAKDSLGNIPWSSKPSVLIDGVTTADDYDIAMSYNNGVEDTAKIAAFDPDSAAAACANYTFPNGQKGYLPSLAEVRSMLGCNECLELIGGTPIDEDGTYYWSSIQADAEHAFSARIIMHDFIAFDKSDRHGCRPVCAYIENK